MYIVARHEDYEQPDFVFAHHDETTTVREAEKLVAAHMKARSPLDLFPMMPTTANTREAQRDLGDAPSLGPALAPVAVWRIHDLYDYTVYKVVTAR